MKKPATEGAEDSTRRWDLSRRRFLLTACSLATTLLGINKKTAKAAPVVASQQTHVQRGHDKVTPNHGIPCQTDVEWTNWSENVSSTPECTFYPKTRDHLIEIVNQAGAEGKKIRVVGDGHSFSPLVATDEYLVSVSKLNKVTVDLSDPNNPLVTMEAGATVGDVLAEMHRHKVSLPTNVVLKTVQYGGLIATGCHGSGLEMVTLSDLVESIDIIDSSGVVRTYTEASVGEEVMNAARLNLGLFGIIHQITLRAVPTFNVHNMDNTQAPRVETLENLKAIVTSHDYVDLFWWPFNENMWLKTYDRTDEPPTVGPSKQVWDALVDFLEITAGQTVYEWLVEHPEHTEKVVQLLFSLLPNREVVESIDHAIHYQEFISQLKVANTEFAFTIDPDFKNVQQAWQVVVDKTEAYAARGEYPFNLTLNARFIKNSNALLSPAFGEQNTCFIEILSYFKTQGWEEFSADVAQEWMKLPGAKPHWPKEFQQIPGIIPFIRQAYGDNLTKFLEIRDQLGVDPSQMFVNSFLQELFFSPL